jgi:hypothetical protein
MCGLRLWAKVGWQFFAPAFFASNSLLRTLGFLSFALRRAAAKESRSPGMTIGGSACVGAVKIKNLGYAAAWRPQALL